MQKTKIPMYSMVWNPITGCTPISEGCQHCYAKTMAETRLRGRCGYPEDEPFRVTVHPERLNEPKSVKAPQRIFVCSMGDLFHDDVPDCRIWEIFGVAEDCPQHQFYCLTKRPYSMHYCFFGLGSPPDNVWLGVTAENQARAEERIPLLLRTPAAHRFVSLEPLLGPIDITPWVKGLDWVIVGAESGAGRRECKFEWVERIIQDCLDYGVPVFYKQGPGDGGKYAKMPVVSGVVWAQVPEVTNASN